MTVYGGPGDVFLKNYLLESPIPEYKVLGENMIMFDNWDDYDSIGTVEYVMGAGTHVKIQAYIFYFELEWGKWYRSKGSLEILFPTIFERDIFIMTVGKKPFLEFSATLVHNCKTIYWEEWAGK